MNALPAPLALVTDRRLCAKPIVDVIADIVDAGIAWIWLRDRDLEASERRRLAMSIRKLTQGIARLTIGADVNLAIDAGADGVHLPSGADLAWARERLGSRALIGVSAHSAREAAAALRAGADYATLSPIFASTSKPGYGPALGLTALSRAADLGIPILALGGVAPSNAGACLRTGARGLAVMGGILAASDPARAVAEYLRAIHASR